MKLRLFLSRFTVFLLMASSALFGEMVHAANHFVSMTGDFTFSPNYLEIDAGDTVTWVNNDSFLEFDHDATSDTATWSTGPVAFGESSSPILFSTPGMFPYRDSAFVGTGMTGTIVVKSTQTPPSPATLTDVLSLPDGAFRFTITNLTAGVETVIAASTNLSDWTPVWTNVPDSDSFPFTNPPISGITRQFFRSWQTP